LVCFLFGLRLLMFRSMVLSWVRLMLMSMLFRL